MAAVAARFWYAGSRSCFKCYCGAVSNHFGLWIIGLLSAPLPGRAVWVCDAVFRLWNGGTGAGRTDFGRAFFAAVVAGTDGCAGSGPCSGDVDAECVDGLPVFCGLYWVLLALVAILLRYSMVMLVLADQPELGALGAIRRSKELMQGYKGSYILLSLSFLGWGLLFLLIAVALAVGALYGILFLGGMDITFLMGHFMLIDLGLNAVLWLGMLPITLWLEPYIMVSVAGFYEMLQPSTNQEELPLL